MTYIYREDWPETIQLDVFIKGFKGVCFWAEPNENSGEKDFDERNKRERTQRKSRMISKVAIAAIILSLPALNFSSDKNLRANAILHYYIIYLIKIVGLYFSIALLAYEIDKNKGIVQQVCASFTKSHCSAVLNSRASKIFGVSWSAIGFFYFGSTTLILLTGGLDLEFKSGLLSIFSLLTLPYMVFSIYYQWRVLKQWCLVCITVLTTLAAELTWSGITFWVAAPSLHFLNGVSLYTYIGCFALLCIPVIVWLIAKPILIMAKGYKELKNKHKRTMMNPDLFKSILHEQYRPSDEWRELGITIGNPAAANTVVKICSPFCGHCAAAHSKLDNLIKHNSDLNLKVIFLAQGSKLDKGVQVVKHLLAIAEAGSTTMFAEALNSWYLSASKNYEAFASKYPINNPLQNHENKVAAMNNWCERAKISYTPTILVNGYMIPREYSIEDLTKMF